METGVKLDRSRKKPNGQGLLEFALIAPVLLLVVFGIIDFGWMVFNYSQVYNGLREGVRYGSVSGFNATPDYKNCQGIYDTLAQRAFYARVDQTKVHIWYDFGLSVEQQQNDYTKLGTPASLGGAPPASVVAYCWWNGSAWSFNLSNATNCTYPACQAAQRSTFDLQNGDRVIVDVNTNVPFVTPLISSFAPNGLNMHFRSARTIFPQGV